MKVVILAGGFGTRISEESYLKPKPMIEIGGKPILWHIMKIYSHYGFNDFIICAGYKQDKIKDYFNNYYLYCGDTTFDYTDGNKKIVHKTTIDPWKVTVVDTGINVMTGGRIKRIQKYVGNETFMLTYGDGVTDLPINDTIKFHKNHGKIATLTAVRPSGRFGTLDLKNNEIVAFREKNKEDVGWINGGYMVLEPEVFDYIKNDNTVMENEPMTALAKNGQLMAYKYDGYWSCMDTIRDKERLEELWKNNNAPWKLW